MPFKPARIDPAAVTSLHKRIGRHADNFASVVGVDGLRVIGRDGSIRSDFKQSDIIPATGHRVIGENAKIDFFDGRSIIIFKPWWLD